MGKAQVNDVSGNPAYKTDENRSLDRARNIYVCDLMLL